MITPYRGSLLELFFSFGLEKCIVCGVCGRQTPSFEPTSALCDTQTANSSMQELVLENQKQKLYKTCFRYKKETRHLESKHLSQPPKYLIIIIMIFNYINDNVTKNMGLWLQNKIWI